jgi:hypothetical protein
MDYQPSRNYQKNQGDKGIKSYSFQWPYEPLKTLSVQQIHQTHRVVITT